MISRHFRHNIKEVKKDGGMVFQGEDMKRLEAASKPSSLQTRHAAPSQGCKDKEYSFGPAMCPEMASKSDPGGNHSPLAAGGKKTRVKKPDKTSKPVIFQEEKGEKGIDACSEGEAGCGDAIAERFFVMNEEDDKGEEGTKGQGVCDPVG